jgi:AcrR family transcriptional regulator
MPPHADQQLQERILKAAQRLWRTRGEHGLTLRAVAREAGTTTPTVYKRFRSKQALQIALAKRFQAQLNEALFATPTVDDLNRTYLRFAEENPHEYQLLCSTWTDVFHPEMPRPGRALLMSQLANRFGGKPEEYGRAFYALFLLTHGAATLLAVPGDQVAHNEVRENFHSVCNTLIENIELFRDRAAPKKKTDSRPRSKNERNSE